MATYVLIHGGSSSAWDWHLLAPLLRARGHEVVAPDLPCADEDAGLAEYADTVVAAVGTRSDLIVVGHSLAGLVAPLVCARLPVERLVLVTAMVPSPGETARQWFANTGQQESMRALAHRQGRSDESMADVRKVFLHDLPAPLADEAAARVRAQSGRPFAEPWPLDAWPDVPTAFVLCRQDRLFPAEFMRRVVRERLGVEPAEIDTGHLPALAAPEALAELLERLRTEADDLVEVTGPPGVEGMPAPS